MNRRKCRVLICMVAVAAVTVSLAVQPALAASGTYIKTSGSGWGWSVSANWQDGVIPGIVANLNTNATDVATFGSAGNTGSAVATYDIYNPGGNLIYLGGLVFRDAIKSSTNVFTIGNQSTSAVHSLYFSPDGSSGVGGVSILVDSSLSTAGQTFSINTSDITLHNAAAGTVPSVYSIISNATVQNKLQVRKILSDSGAATLVLGGASPDATLHIPNATGVGLFGTASNPLTLVKSGSGTWTLPAGLAKVTAIDVQEGVLKAVSNNTGGAMVGGLVEGYVPFNIASGAYVDVVNTSTTTTWQGGPQVLPLKTSAGSGGLELTGNGSVVNSGLTGSAGPTGAWGYGEVQFQSGRGRLSPGNNGVGALHMGKLTMAGYNNLVDDGTAYFWDVVSVAGPGLQAAGVGADLLDIHGALDLQGVEAAGTANQFRFGLNSGLSAPAAVAGWQADQTYSWVIAQTTGGIVGAIPTFNSGDHAFVLDGLASFADHNVLSFSSTTTGEQQFSLSQSGNDLLLTYNGSAPTGVASTAGDGTFDGATTLTTKAPAGASLAGLATVSDSALATKATLTDGTSSALVTLAQQWRTRTDAEKTLAGGGLISDVVNFTGLTAGDEFMIELTYSQAELDSIWGSGKTPYLAWLDGADWVKAGDGGFDAVAKTAWTTVNHGGQFAVFAMVPEPGTVTMLLMSCFGLALFAWKRR